MPSTLPILRARRDRRLAQQSRGAARTRGVIVSGGAILSFLLAGAILLGALAYADITRSLPSTEILPHLLNPPDGLLVQPTRMYDRSGMQLLFTFAPEETPRRYLPINKENPEHIPPQLINAILAAADPQFNAHPGYLLRGYNDPLSHPTIAQKLVNAFLLYQEDPTTRRALRERLLAGQITAQFGQTKILEWYLNSANFGHHAYGVDAASRLYFNKPVGQLTLAEAAILAATSESPSLNPLDAPQRALQRGRDLLYQMNYLRLAESPAIAQALVESPSMQTPLLSPPITAPAFVNLVLAQVDTQIPRERVERGGMTILSTLQYDLQKNAVCLTETYAARLAGQPDPKAGCDSARWLAPLPPTAALTDSSASALILDTTTGQVLAMVGETNQGRETPLVTAHKPGSILDAFVYLTGFTRGLSPASLTWDIPTGGSVENFDGTFHGPMRLRIALANDYQVPVETLRMQMGQENITRVASSFGVDLNTEISLLELAGAYGVFSTQGVYFGRMAGGQFGPTSVLRVESADGLTLMDWSTPDAQSIVTPAISYLMTHILSDETARSNSLGASNSLQIGRPAGVKVGQTSDGRDSWTVGFTPTCAAAVWTGVRGENESISPRLPSVLWSALMQTVSENAPPDGWSRPQDVITRTVCDPSGMLPTSECPNRVMEVFISGSEPTQADTLFREFSVNRETGLLATVFTPPEFVDTRTYMIIPENARGWARDAGLEIPPASYDAIQAPPFNPNVNILSPEFFSEVQNKVQITGTAGGDHFVSYRLQAGKGLNPKEWIQIGSDGTEPVTKGLLAEWDTRGLSGLYALQLIVVREGQLVETAVIQVTVREQP